MLYDNISPSIKEVEITGEKGENEWYRGDVGISLENAEDAHSGVAGYYYYRLTEEEITNGFTPSIEQMLEQMTDKKMCDIKSPMKVADDGIKTAIFIVQDKAGNVSNPITVKVKKDNEAPKKPGMSYKDVKTRGFTLNAGTSDNLTSVIYDFYVIIDGEAKLVGSTKDGECIVTGLKTSTTYTCFCIARDEAGNTSRSDNVYPTTKGEIPKPVITVTPKAGTELGNNGWYKGPVDVTIEYNNTDTAEGLTMKYSVTGKTNMPETVTEETRVNVGEIRENGISTVTAYTVDKDGEMSEIAKEDIKIDSIAPNPPIITETGAKGPDTEDIWYRSNILVTVTGGEDEHSGVGGIRYSTTGANEISERELNGNIVTFTLTQDGRTVVTAYTVDQAGNISAPATKEMKKDNVAPTGVTLNVSAGPWSIKGEATAQDDLSGIYSYTFQYKKKNESNWQTGETKITTENTCSGTIKDLETLTEYDIKLIAIDKAGNEETYIGNGTTEREPQVGDYVNYKPDKVTLDNPYTVLAKYSGHTEDQTFTTEEIGWRIWEIDKKSNKLVLCSTAYSKATLTLVGAQGVNNGVIILNDLCKACYSNETMGAIGRSVDLEDAYFAINKGERPFKAYYNPVKNVIPRKHDKYKPYAFYLTDNFFEDKEDSLNPSEQYEYYEGDSPTVEISNTEPHWRMYNINEDSIADRRGIGDNMWYPLLYEPGGRSVSQIWWLATRVSKEFFSGADGYTIYTLPAGGSDAVSFTAYMFTCNTGTAHTQNYRPFVEIDMKDLLFEGIGSSSSPFQLSKAN